jgi:hypothetical protein
MKRLTMKTGFAALALASLLCGVASAQTAPATAPAAITGVWRGQMDNLPAVTLTITDEGGKLSGAILFFLHVRATVNDPWTSRPATAAEPILNPVFDGKTLRFMVNHKRAHPPRTLNDPPSHFHLTLTGPNQAGLVNETEAGPGDAGPGLPMVRSDY